MTDEHSLERLSHQNALLLKRIERLDGKYEELRRQIVPPGILYPKRSDFEALESRVTRLEERKQTRKK